MRQEKKDCPLFSWGETPPRPLPNTQLLEVALPLRERVIPRSQQDEVFGEEKFLGRGEVDTEKKGKKDAQKKVGKKAVV